MILKARSFDINEFTNFVHDWLSNFGKDFSDDNLKYNMLS